jgi:peptidyl-prolyl cis-trans isomerase C
MNLFLVSRISAPPHPVALAAARRQCAAIAFGAALFAASGSSFAQSPVQNPSPTPAPSAMQNSSPAQDPVIARVGDAEIRESDVRLADEEFGKLVPPHEGTDRREYLINFLADLIRLSKEAKAHNVGDDAEIRRRMELTREKALFSKLLEETSRAAVTDQTVREAFDIYAEKNPSQPELHLRYMLFRFPSPDDQAAVDAALAKAKEALKLVAGGEEFDMVATKMSEDPGSRIDRGELGYMTRTQMGKDYADVAFKLHQGEVSAPIKTSFGWHVIRVEGERISQAANFDQMRPSLTSFLSRNAQLQLIDRLRKATPIERLDQATAAAVPAKPAE